MTTSIIDNNEILIFRRNKKSCIIIERDNKIFESMNTYHVILRDDYEERMMYDSFNMQQAMQHAIEHIEAIESDNEFYDSCCK